MDAKLKAAIAQLGEGRYKPGSSVTEGYVYNPLPFPECESVPCHRPNSDKRWDIIARHTDLSNKCVIDLGCATGYFSFQALDAGAVGVLGIDRDTNAVRVCREAARAYDVKGCEFVHGSIEHLRDRRCDVAFALSVLNWLGKRRADEFLLWAAENTDVLWAEVQLKGDGRRGANWLESNGDIKNWLGEYFTSVSNCGKTRGPHRGKWRAMWRCT